MLSVAGENEVNRKKNQSKAEPVKRYRKRNRALETSLESLDLAMPTSSMSKYIPFLKNGLSQFDHLQWENSDRDLLDSFPYIM